MRALDGEDGVSERGVEVGGCSMCLFVWFLGVCCYGFRDKPARV